MHARGIMLHQNGARVRRAAVQAVTCMPRARVRGAVLPRSARARYPHVNFRQLDGFDVGALTALSPSGAYDKVVCFAKGGCTALEQASKAACGCALARQHAHPGSKPKAFQHFQTSMTHRLLSADIHRHRRHRRAARCHGAGGALLAVSSVVSHRQSAAPRCCCCCRACCCILL